MASSSRKKRAGYFRLGSGKEWDLFRGLPELAQEIFELPKQAGSYIF